MIPTSYFSFSGTLAYTQMSIEWDYPGEQLVLTLKRNSGGTLTGLTYVANDPSGQHWETLPGSDVSNMEQQATAQLCGVTYRATMVAGSTAVTITRREATTLGWETLTTDTGADFDAGLWARAGRQRRGAALPHRQEQRRRGRSVDAGVSSTGADVGDPRAPTPIRTAQA